MKTTTTTIRDYDDKGNVTREETVTVVEDAQQVTPTVYPQTPTIHPQTSPGWWQLPGYQQHPYTVTCGTTTDYFLYNTGGRQV